jgi:hypothetical protein
MFMAKRDFEFYQFDGLEDEFVVPAPASDPYRGTYDLSALPDIAINAIAMTVEVSAGSVEVERIEEPLDYFEAQDFFYKAILTRGGIFLWQRVKMTAAIKAQESVHSEEFRNIDRLLTSTRSSDVMPTQREARADMQPQVVTASRHTHCCDWILDEDDRPAHPNILVKQALTLRAYQWLPGPVRRSFSGGQFKQRTYSPRPVNLTAIQTIEIEGINPLVED